MLFELLCATVLSGVPTVDAIEGDLASRDVAIDAEWSALSDRAGLERKREAFKAGFRKATGFGKIRRTPLNAKLLGVKSYGAFRIEKVMMESAPGAFVPLLVFLPDPAKFAPPYAGFVFIPGHSDNGKGAASYLHTCELGARHGLASVIYDPLGQGERTQGAGLGNVQEHVRIGEYAVLLGETTATYMLRDASRVLDYLESRPDVDGARLGVCGQSGGGTISAYLMTADDRIKAAVPTCYLSSAREHILACGPQDAEQNFFGWCSWGFNHAAMILSAGCPVMINASVGDFFQIEGSRSTYGVVKGVAERAGLPGGWYGLSENPGPHSMSKSHREQAIRFFLAHLDNVAQPVVEADVVEFASDDYTVTPDGDVSRLCGFRSVYDEIADRFVELGVSADQAAVNAKPLVHGEVTGNSARDVLATLGGNVEKGKVAVLRIGGQATPDEATAVLFAEGARYMRKPSRKGKVSCYERRGDDEVVAVDLYIAGRSLAALRAAELLVLSEELRQRTGLAPEVVVSGRFSMAAKFALAAAPDAFAAVRYEDEPESFLESLKSRRALPFAVSGAVFSGKGE